jgi:hypothetical protein
MPLCPQITNTPITVTLTADFTVTDVVPVVPATTEDLAAVEVLIDGKAEIYYQTTAPVGAGINENDLWYDTDDGNKPYIYRSSVWVSAQDGSIATAQSAANTALANAATANAVGVAAQNTANTALANAATANAVGVAAQGTANTALANAAIADAKGVAAQNTANTALANASTAYTAAIGSLQPSANTIVNASNQMTAINGTGITVYSGASATSGARVVLNSAGLAGFNAGGTATFSISASTGAAVFSGSVTGSTITGGTLNIGGNAIIDASGFLTATGATITGTITTNNITVTGGTLTIGSTFAVTAGGVLTATGATITGTLTSNNITVTGGTLTIGSTFAVTSGGVLTATGATITGTLTSNNVTITGGTLTIGSKFSVTSTGVLTATDGVFTGTVTSTNATITGGSLTVGSTFSVTSAGVLTATSGTVGGFTLTSTYLGGAGGFILNSNGQIDGGSGNTIFYGKGNFGGGTAGSETLIVTGTSNFNGTLTGLAITANGSMTANAELFAAGHSTTANAANGYVFTTGGRIARSTASSERYKENIVNLLDVPELNPKKLLSLPVRAFTYKDGELPETDDRYQQLIPGFIAEEVDAIYPIAADYVDGPESWNDRMIVPALLSLVQDLYKEVQTLKGE